MKKKILIYSFEKFDKLQSNPAAKIGKELFNLLNDKINVKFLELKTTFDSWKILKREIDNFKPEFVLGLGVAPQRSRICIEAMAINIIDSTKPDNAQKIIQHSSIINEEVLAIKSNVDLGKILDNFTCDNIPSAISYFAGTYVCNHHYYNCLNYSKKLNFKTIFIHVPLSPKEIITLDVDMPCFPTKLISNSLKNYFLNNQPTKT